MVRVSPKKSIKKTIWTLLMGFSTIILFQNCSDLNNADVITVDDITSTHLENLPFAFDVSIDQMAYMSCTGKFAAGDPAAFTFKAGAFSPGSGLRLRNNYLAQIANLNTDVQAMSLDLSPRNFETGAVLSIRERNYLQDYLKTASDAGETPISRMMFNEGNNRFYSSEHYARRLLASSGNYMNYMPGLSGFVYKGFDGMLRFADNKTAETTVRNYLSNSHYLTITFPEPLGSQPPNSQKPFVYVRSPHGTTTGNTNALTSVFGKAYALSFQQFDGRMPTTPARIMSVDSTVNLENQSIVGETWDCSERFVIVRPQDAKRKTYDPVPDDETTDPDNRQICDLSSDQAPANNAEQRRWERIRNVLPVEHWYVSLPTPVTTASGDTYIKPGCIVPKQNDFCYDWEQETGGVNNPNFRVAYYYEEDRSGAEWNFDAEGITYEGKCGTGTNFICPHYVTICHKN